MLSSLVASLYALFAPARCVACGDVLPEREIFACYECRLKMPLTGYHTDFYNPMAERLRALNPAVEFASALFFFHGNGGWRHVIHQIKYKSRWYAAQRLGALYGCDLKNEPHFRSVDVIVPIPLHRSRRLKRRYNQSEEIARGLAKELDAQVVANAVIRRRNNPSQVTRSHTERWDNVQDIFAVKSPARLAGKHILLVDDVFTTGATIASCVGAIRGSLPTARISVVTLAALQQSGD